MTSICKEKGELGRNLAKEIGKYQFEHFEGFPRAIPLTFAFYTLGVPPEVIGTGRGLMETQKRMGERAFEDPITAYYPSLRTL